MVDGGANRIGFLADGDPGTDLMSATYEYDETGVRLDIPFQSHADPRSRWWPRSMHMDDLDRTKYSYAPPAELNYFDAQGRVGLIGCESGPSNHNMGLGVGRGTVRARYSVEKAHDAANYVRLNGLRSEIDGFAHWLAFSAHQTTIKFSPDGRDKEITTTMKPVDDLPLGRRLNLKAVAIGTAPGTWSPEVAYRSTVFLETSTKSSKSWEEHLQTHIAIRNLLRVAAWRPINFQAHRALSLLETVDVKGKTLRQWRDVRTATTGIADGVWASKDKFLFYFTDIGTRGITRWLRLVTSYERGLSPFVGLLDLEGATIDALVSQLGIALEAVGYQALIEAGRTPTAANNAAVAKRIDCLLAEVSGNLSFNDNTFGQDFADSYNSVKHANRALVGPIVKLEHFRQGVELLRVWIALRLGVTPATLKARR